MNLESLHRPKRDVVLFARITKQNKNFIKSLADKEDVKEAALVDFIISSFRKTKRVGRKRKVS